MEELINKFERPCFEPKMETRFTIEFPKEFGIANWAVQKSNLPTYKFGIIKKKLQPITIEFLDPIQPSTALGLDNITKRKNKKFSIIISMLGPVGDVVERWELDGCKIVSINFGILDYSSDNFLSPSMTIRPKKCTRS